MTEQSKFPIPLANALGSTLQSFNADGSTAATPLELKRAGDLLLSIELEIERLKGINDGFERGRNLATARADEAEHALVAIHRLYACTDPIYGSTEHYRLIQEVFDDLGKSFRRKAGRYP